MAIFLYRLVRRKLQERQTQKLIPSTDDSHLVPEIALEPRHQQQEQQQLTESPAAARDIDAIQSINAQAATRQKAEARQRTKRMWKLVLGLALPNFLAAVDVTIVAPAIPLISSHFNQLSGGFNWVVAAYTLTFTTFVPASGQLADIYGRHFALQFEVFWILVGSVLCAAAQSWAMLLIGRALQGLGAAGIMSLSRIILSDGATLAETARGNTIMSLISGISYAIGPVIGGYLAVSSWRYLFVVPSAVAAVSMIVIFLAMRKDLLRGRASDRADGSRRLGYITGLAIIDWPGMIIFILGIGSIILAIQWGGTQYSWDSAAVIAPLIVGAILCVVFFGYEYLLGPGRAVARLFPDQVPMIPSTLFRKKDTSLLMIINFSAGISLVCAFYFISYYFQFAEGYSASQAGLQLLYYTPGLGAGVYSAMFLCNRWPRQTFFPLFWGSVVEGVGLALLAYSISIRDQVMVKVFLAISGAGTGLRFMPIVLHAAGIWSTRIPSMQSLLSFMLPLGETIGISMMGSIFSNKLHLFLSRIPGLPGDFALHDSSAAGLDILNDPTLKDSVSNAAAKAVMWALIAVLPFVALSIVASISLGNVWIGKAAEQAKNGQIKREAEKGQVLYSAYLPALLSGGVQAQKCDLDVDSEREGKQGDNACTETVAGPTSQKGRPKGSAHWV